MGPNLCIKDRNKKLLQQLLERAGLKPSYTSEGVAPPSPTVSPFKYISPSPNFKLLPPIELTTYRLKKMVEEMYGPPIDRTNWSKPFRFSSDNEKASSAGVTQSSGAPSPRTASCVVLPRSPALPGHSTGDTLGTKEQERLQHSARETRDRQSGGPEVVQSTLMFKIISGFLIFVLFLVILICIVSI